MFLGEIDAALNLWGRLRRWWLEKRSTPTETIAIRFVRLFESHGVHRNQIPRYFGHGIQLWDMRDDEALLEVLNDDILTAACVHFSVSREWLDGADSKVHPSHDFYKKPQEFVDFVSKIQANNPDGYLRGCLIAPIEMDWDARALLILKERVGAIGEKSIYRYHLCNNWVFPYWKARAYLTACVAAAWNLQAFVDGTYAPRNLIEELSEGKILLGWQGDGFPNFGGKRWYPEDMALRPEAFLHGVDREIDNYGARSGLELWLELEEKGLMNTGLNKHVRHLFQEERAKY